MTEDIHETYTEYLSSAIPTKEWPAWAIRELWSDYTRRFGFKFTPGQNTACNDTPTIKVAVA